MIYRVSAIFHKDFVEVNNNEIIIGITAKPEKGEANREIIKKLSKYFDVSKSKVKIIAGEKSRKKLVEVIH